MTAFPTSHCTEVFVLLLFFFQLVKNVVGQVKGGTKM